MTALSRKRLARAGLLFAVIAVAMPLVDSSASSTAACSLAREQAGGATPRIVGPYKPAVFDKIIGSA